MITFLFKNKLASLASKPLFSFPAIGCAGIKLLNISSRIRFAEFAILDLVLPTSVTIIC